MTPMLLALIAASAQASSPPPSADPPRVEKQASIAFADHGGLRNWKSGKQPDIAYVQDRYFRWYRVALNGPCIAQMHGAQIGYTTDAGGRFDRFSRVFSVDSPGISCGVTSVVRVATPKGEIGAEAKVHDRR